MDSLILRKGVYHGMLLIFIRILKCIDRGFHVSPRWIFVYLVNGIIVVFSLGLFNSPGLYLSLLVILRLMMSLFRVLIFCSSFLSPGFCRAKP